MLKLSKAMPTARMICAELCRGVHTAFYLLHSINAGKNFDEVEKCNGERILQRLRKLKIVSQIIYLGGIANDKNRSQHLASRMNTGTQLASGKVPVLELRAGIIIGSGSASFEMLRHLTHRLPVMTTPKWVSNLTQPISIRDALYYLRKCAALPTPIAKDLRHWRQRSAFLRGYDAEICQAIWPAQALDYSSSGSHTQSYPAFGLALLHQYQLR
jgi:hypothetical protein